MSLTATRGIWKARIDLERERRRRDIEPESGHRFPSFGSWLHTVTPAWRWDWPHLVEIRRHLEQVTLGHIKKLLVLCPPRMGKTEQGTIRYAAYRLELDPTLPVIVGAYNATLATKFSRRARRIARERIALSAERQAADDWETTAGGGLRAVGVGSGVTGHGSRLILIDDPIKSREEAESAAYRERCWDWYTDDIYTRLEPGAAIVLTYTPWHADDLGCRILASEDGPNWTVVRLPALAETQEERDGWARRYHRAPGLPDPLGRTAGEPLCPDRYDLEALEDRQRVLGPTGFTSLFQLRPVPEEGGRFKQRWFRYWEPAGDGLVRLDHGDGRSDLVRLELCRVFATEDSATSERTQADYTVISVWAVTPAKDLILLHRERERLSDPKAVDLSEQVYQRWRPQYFGVEGNSVGQSRAQNMRARGLPVKEIHVHSDKIARSTTAVIRCEAGQVFWPRSTPGAPVHWLEEWEREHTSFPHGEHDDQVDTTSLAAQEVFESPGNYTGGAEAVPPDHQFGVRRRGRDDDGAGIGRRRLGG